MQSELQREQRNVMSQTQRSKYVFAGRPVETPEDAQTKVCPRCGAVLFADMDVCYGCLYDFTRDSAGWHGTVAGGFAGKPELTAQVPLVDDSLDTIAIDEIDDEDDSDGAVGERRAAVDEAPSAQKPRHRRSSTSEGDSADSTLDLSSAVTAAGESAGGLSVLISSPTMRVCVPVPEQGLLVGRDESNDIVLRSRTVSRNHLRLVPQGRSLAVEDLGATNPAMLLGAPIGQQSQIGPGQSVAICDTTLTVVGKRESPKL